MNRNLRVSGFLLAGALVIWMTGCSQAPVAGPSNEVMASFDTMMKAKAQASPDFARWIRDSGKYTAQDLDGKWELWGGSWDPARGTYSFQDTGARVSFTSNPKTPNSLDFAIQNYKGNAKGTAVLDTRRVPNMTFFTAVQPKPARPPASRPTR